MSTCVQSDLSMFSKVVLVLPRVLVYFQHGISVWSQYVFSRVVVVCCLVVLFVLVAVFCEPHSVMPYGFMVLCFCFEFMFMLLRFLWL